MSYYYNAYLNKGYTTINKNSAHGLRGSTSILFVNQLEYIEINSSDFLIHFIGDGIGGGGSAPSITGVSYISLPEGLTQLTEMKWGGVLDDYTNIQIATFNVNVSDGSNKTVELYIIPVYFPVTDFIMENSITVKINLEYVMQLWEYDSNDEFVEVYPRYYFKDGTPEGLSIDENSGEITGSVTTPQTYTICWEIPSLLEGYIQVGSLENYYICNINYENFESFIVTTDITISPKIKYEEYLLNNRFKYIPNQNN
ncbi:MAG: hypothetical protein IJ997_01600 [Mycoplasmataceae bacterium]|nr:hypothetical protein [Mycoplasmataceae bacterium]